MNKKRRLKLHISGQVQGVGFRPFIYNLAQKYHLKGYVFNDSLGVVIEVEGEGDKLKLFVNSLKAELPPAAFIETIKKRYLPLKEDKSFLIKESVSSYDKFIFIAPDLAICRDCLKELFDKNNRRFLYPFINCTNCGPRYSIIKNIPYDRRQTTMKEFRMCKECLSEYNLPYDRRFHAQPNACFKCGPHIELWDKINKFYFKKFDLKSTRDLLIKACILIKEGKILAIKGLSGYHIACDARNIDVLKLLRARKQRPTKPFALMVDNIKLVKRLCFVNRKEEELFFSPFRPIVLLRINKKEPWMEEVAPRQEFLGIMLAYAPLHYLVFSFLKKYIKEPILVMTSANPKDYPLVKEERELNSIRSFVDAFLVHNRKIYMRADDSIVRVWRRHIYFIRKARGYIPDFFVFPAKLSVLGCGAELKHTFSLTKNNYLITSPYLGDLKNVATYNFFLETLRHFKNIFNFNPQIVAYDYHPQYLSSQYAESLRGVKKIRVQHHHAHLVSCMVENNLYKPVLGVIFDGIGFGLDGAVWGGEFLVGSRKDFKRVGFFEYFGLVGKDKAIEEPWRVTLYFLYKLFKEKIFDLDIDFVKEISPSQLNLIIHLIKQKYLIYTSSVGRLFDALASLLRLNDRISYEAEAAINLEMIALKTKGDFYNQPYRFEIVKRNAYIIKWEQIFLDIISDIKRKKSYSVIAARFHYTLGKIIERLCILLRKEYNINEIVLSGGVFQNWFLSQITLQFLRKKGFLVYTHSRFSPNDSCISVGQVAVAHAKLKDNKE